MCLSDNLTLLDVPLKVNTERMELEKCKLVTAKDPKPTKGAHLLQIWFYRQLRQDSRRSKAWGS